MAIITTASATGQRTNTEPRSVIAGLTAVMPGQLIQGMGADHVVWGTNAIWTGSPLWRIEALRRLEMPEALQKKYGYAPLGAADGMVSNAISGGNNARLYKVPASLRARVAGDQLVAYKALYDKHFAGRTNLACSYVNRLGA